MNTTIVSLHGREILDSRGRPTVEAVVQLADGTAATASVPSGASTGQHEAVELRDGDPERYGGLGVRHAVLNIDDVVGPVLRGRDVTDQAALDATLCDLDGTPDKSRLGANALLAVSVASARAAAQATGVPLWQRFAVPEARPALPLPMVNIVSGGLHAGQILDVQDFLVIPIGAVDYQQALEQAVAIHTATAELLRRNGSSTLRADEGGFGPALASNEAGLELLVAAIEHTGLTPGDDAAIALDVAATHFYDAESGHYRMSRDASTMKSADMIELLADWCARYPIVSIEDGLAEDDWDGWAALTARLGGSVQLIGDDLFTTDPMRLERGIQEESANSVLVKMNQIGTLSETLEVVSRARSANLRTVVSARSGETEDSALADLAVGTGAGQIKVGSVTQSERLAKYNQLLRIAEQHPSIPFARWQPVGVPTAGRSDA